MTWLDVWEIVSKYWIQQVAVLITACAVALYNKRFKRYANDQKAIKLAMLA